MLLLFKINFRIFSKSTGYFQHIPVKLKNFRLYTFVCVSFVFVKIQVSARRKKDGYQFQVIFTVSHLLSSQLLDESIFWWHISHHIKLTPRWMVSNTVIYRLIKNTFCSLENQANKSYEQMNVISKIMAFMFLATKSG